MEYALHDYMAARQLIIIDAVPFVKSKGNSIC